VSDASGADPSGLARETERTPVEVAREAQATDSAGLPWSGRALTSTGFDGDVGAADPDLLAALDDSHDETTLMGAVAQARLLVPIVAAPSEVDDSGQLRVDLVALKSATDMAVVTLTAPDGRMGKSIALAVAEASGFDLDQDRGDVLIDFSAPAALQSTHQHPFDHLLCLRFRRRRECPGELSLLTCI
jgi:hypothetical protein